MKTFGKLSLILIVAALLMLVPVGLVFGDAGGNVKGEVTEIDETGRILTLKTNDGEVFVSVQESFDLLTIEVGMTVLAKGQWANDTDLIAQWVKQVGPDDDEEKLEDGEKTFKNSFCTGEKATNHPLAAKIVAKYGESAAVDEEQIMTWFCEGHSFGQIMLALTTHILDGSDPAEVLAAKKDGQGWGKIWKDKGLIGNEREGMPPGWVKKPNKAIPPGQLKKTPTP